ncbi:MAG TPA: hypothetical protein VF589_11215, partial [Allosphingosinicella sp.]
MPRTARLTKFLSIPLLGWATAAAAGYDLRFAGRDGAELVRYLDADSINRRGDVVAFWMTDVRGAPGAGGEIVETLGAAHCSELSFRPLQSRRNPTSTLRQPTWVVSTRAAWRQFGEEHRTAPGASIRAVIAMACAATDPAATAEQRLAALTAPPSMPAAPSRVESAAASLAATPSDPATAAPAPAGGLAAASPPSSPAESAALEAAAAAAIASGNIPVGIGTATAGEPLPSARLSAWVDMGASITGQAIEVDAASVDESGASPTGWFRLINPDEEAPTSVSYLLRVDCRKRTINQLGLRRHGAGGTITEERDYGPAGEGPMEVEAETVMEIAYRGLCTGEGARGLRQLAGLPPDPPARSETAAAPPPPP